MTTGKTTALTVWTFASIVMSLLSGMLFVIPEHIYQLKSTKLDGVTKYHYVTISLILMNVHTNT